MVSFYQLLSYPTVTVPKNMRLGNQTNRKRNVSNRLHIYLGVPFAAWNYLLISNCLLNSHRERKTRFLYLELHKLIEIKTWRPSWQITTQCNKPVDILYAPNGRPINDFCIIKSTYTNNFPFCNSKLEKHASYFHHAAFWLHYCTIKSLTARPVFKFELHVEML